MSAIADGANHVSPEELLDTLRARGHRIGTATLYQNLNRLAEAGLLVRFAGLDGRIRFDGNTDPHHHLVCASCGRVVDIDICVDRTFFRKLRPVAARSSKGLAGWRVEGGQLELKGTCPACSKGP